MRTDFSASDSTGTTGTSALLALAPTASFDKKRRHPAVERGGGDAQRRPPPLVFDAYIERDDVPIGVAGPGGRQSYFTDTPYDTSGNPGSFVDQAANPTLIRRSGNFNSISTGTRALPRESTRVNDGSWAVYSPQRPDPDHPGPVARAWSTRRERAFSDQIPRTWVACRGNTSGGVVRLIGTSSATPQITRKKLNKM